MFCFYCEDGVLPKNLREKGYVWLHLDCFEKLDDLYRDTQHVKKILEGKYRGTKLDENVEKYLKRMQDFEEHWVKLMNKIKKLTGIK